MLSGMWLGVDLMIGTKKTCNLSRRLVEFFGEVDF